MFKKLLIANRSEIACRVIKTASVMNIPTVAIYSEADKGTRHTRLATEAYCIGPAKASDSYLNMDKIIEVAKQCDADAIHPGFGFLSENATFAKLCEKNGITFIGPSIDAITQMGSKQIAKQIMEKAGVPVIPGYHGTDQSKTTLAKQAKSIGYPVLIKAAAGGGGKGMRLVRSPDEFGTELEGAKREAKAAFSDETMIIEKFIENPRHIEFQVFGDTKGNAVHLFERDCSIQRRHQKIIEESPAVNFSDELRNQMGETAVKAAQSIGYVGAGTIEFILSDNNEFYFMEMNTRLQVEHPVTEMITGVDLVEWQIRIAAGEPLPLKQDKITSQGHAIEARVYAEDPNQAFLPATGTIKQLQLPEHSKSIRVDHGISQGDAIGIYYDPMLAKVIAHGPTREDAQQKLVNALSHFVLNGVTINAEYLTHVLNTKSFTDGQINTHFIEAHCNELSQKLHDTRQTHQLLALLLRFVGQKSTSPWHQLQSWRHFSSTHQTVELATTSKRISAQVSCGETNDSYTVVVDKVASVASNVVVTASMIEAVISGVTQVGIYQQTNNGFLLTHKGLTKSYGSNNIHASDGLNTESETHLNAPMSANVISVLCKPGQQVKRGEKLMVLEAMKMEHTITAPEDGIIEHVRFKLNDLVNEGEELIAFES